MVERIKLASGLELAFKEFKGAASTSVGIWVRKGARSEPLAVKGIAHFLEHLLFKGSKNYDYKQIKQQIEGKGGQLNAFTSQEVTCYFAKVLGKDLNTCLDVLSDMVALPLLKEKDINKERAVILEEIKMYQDMPVSRVSSLLDRLLWDKNPLAIDVIGKTSTVRDICRKSMLSFKDNFYRPSNIVVVVCGKNPRSFRKKILQKFPVSGYRKKPASFPEAGIKPGFNFAQEVTSFEQTHLSLGFAAFKSSDKRRFILSLINTILGGNMSSRLFESIREKRGLAYDVSSGIKKYSDTGAFVIHCGLEADNLTLAFEVILKELAILKDSLVSSKELLRAKEYLLGNFLMSSESTMNYMLFAGDSICNLNRVLQYKDIEKAILAVTASDIQKAARDIFYFENLRAAIVTNKKQSFKSPFERILKKYQ